MFIDITEQNRERLGASFKFTMDLAELLEWATVKCQTNPKEVRNVTGSFRDMFEQFNAALVQSGGEAVRMPVEWAWPLAVHASAMVSDKQRMIKIFEKINAHGTADEMHRALEEELTYDYLVESFARLILDAVLCDRGLAPSRERLASVKLQSAAQRLAPKKPLTALCLDDDAWQIMRTLSAMAGWEGIRLTMHLQAVPPQDDFGDIVSDRLADIVIRSEAEIVLMDHGLRNTNGCAVIAAVKRLDPAGKRVFVVNTGGGAYAFEGTGAIGDCRKGQDLTGIEDAIRILQGDPLPPPVAPSQPMWRDFDDSPRPARRRRRRSSR